MSNTAADKAAAKKAAESNQSEAPAEAAAPVETAGSGSDTVTVKDTERIEGVYDETGGEAYVTLTKDVVEEFFYPGTKRPATRILFTKGQVVQKSLIDSLNSRVEAAKKAADGETALEDYVDSTTLASGTGANASS